MDITAEQIARHLGGARKSGDNWSCRCPAHEDKHASLSIKDGENGKILVRCHAGCHQDDVVNQLKIHSLWPGSRITPPRALPPPPVQINLGKDLGKIVAEYNYVDESGQVLYQAVRYEPKTFRQRHQNEYGKWVWNLNGIRRVLYKLPNVIEAVKEGRTIYICEGEKDVHAAEAIGLVATCNAMGADNGAGNKWLPEFGEILRGADVVVVPDQDDAGTRHAEWVISTLESTARSVKVVNPAVGKDLADWIEAGATLADIQAAAVDAFEIEVAPKPKSFAFVDVKDLISNIKPIQWLVRNYFERDSLALIFGSPGCGKSFFAVDVACSIATGTEWFGNPVHHGKVFYIAGEGHNGLARRFKAWEVSRNVPIQAGQIYKSAGAMSVLDEESAVEVSEQIYQLCEATGELPAVVVIDTVARNYGAGDENSTADMSKFIDHIDTYIRKRYNCCVLLVHHSGHNMDRARGSSALKAAVDAEYEVTKDDSGTVKIRTTKMKDAELPEDMLLRLKGIELPGVLDEDGNQVTSAVLDYADDLINTKVGNRMDRTPILSKDVLAVLDRGWLSIRELGDALGCSKRQVDNVLDSLTRFGYIKDKAITEEGRAALSRTGYLLTQQDKPVWKREGA